MVIPSGVEGSRRSCSESTRCLDKLGMTGERRLHSPTPRLFAQLTTDPRRVLMPPRNHRIQGDKRIVSEKTTSAATERLWRAIEEREDELIGLVADLVRIPSLLGEEAPAQGFVEGYLAASGLQTESWDISDDLKQRDNAGDSGIPFAGRPNVAGTAPGAGGGRSLILNGHIDVVSAEPVQLWDARSLRADPQRRPALWPRRLGHEERRRHESLAGAVCSTISTSPSKAISPPERDRRGMHRQWRAGRLDP